MKTGMKTGMIKNILILLACALATNAHAIAKGFYMGAMAGPADSKARSLQATIVPANSPNPAAENPTFLPATPRGNIFGVRLFMGYLFNQFAGIEAGGTFISSIRYAVPGLDPATQAVYGSTDQRVRDLDVVLKGVIPIKWFSVYGKLGVAATYITSGGTFNPVVTRIDPTQPATSPTNLNVGTTYKHKASPTFSIGAGYDIDQSWVVDLSMNTIAVGNDIGNVTFIALGLSYHFTDKYCGQFLCDD